MVDFQVLQQASVRAIYRWGGVPGYSKIIPQRLAPVSVSLVSLQLVHSPSYTHICLSETQGPKFKLTLT